MIIYLYVFLLISTSGFHIYAYRSFILRLFHFQIRVPCRPIETKLTVLPTNRDKLPSGKQILALTLTWVIYYFTLFLLRLAALQAIISCYLFFSCSYKFKLEDGAEVKPQIPLLNNRIYDTKFESQFYMISDTNKVLHQIIKFLVTSYSRKAERTYVLSRNLVVRGSELIFLSNINSLR